MKFHVIIDFGLTSKMHCPNTKVGIENEKHVVPTKRHHAMTWIEHNDLMFNNKRWNLNKVHKVIWDALLDYGKVAWNTCEVN